MAKYNISLIEDDLWFSETIKYYLELNEDNIVSVFETAEDFFEKKPKVDIICLDYNLPGINGYEAVKRIMKELPDVATIMMSAQQDMQTTLNLMKMGVKDYIIKTEHAKDLIWKAVEEVKENKDLKKKIKNLETKLAAKSTSSTTLVGEDGSMKKIKKLIEKASESNINVSISGETGTGKEVVAQKIHELSERSKYPFIPVNMGALPSELVESELFGYEKGAFTGAVKRTKGKFELANGGTLFLDEIADLDMHLQSKILRALQEMEITPLGSENPVKLDIRLIVATHKNLAEEVETGRFREDLFYRIIGLPIHLPPLRERGSDILLIANHFLNKFAEENGKEVLTLDKKAKDKIIKYSYPGNIRELKAIIDLSAVLVNDKVITEDDIRFNSFSKKNMFLNENLTLKEITEQVIFHYLKKNNQNVQKTARDLDIGKSTIYNLLNKANESSHI